VLRPIKAGIGEHPQLQIEGSESKIHSDATDLSGAQFVNATKGWVFNRRSLFVTSDSGKSWRRLLLDLPTDASVSSVFFSDESRGWLAKNIRLTTEPYGLGNSATILVTFDGGVSWIEQANFRDGVQINRVKFLDANHGFAIGSRLKNNAGSYDEIFVAKTADGGKTWVDISEKTKPAVDNGGGVAAGLALDVHWLSPDDIILLMSRTGRIIVTSDAGETWKTLARFQDERPNGTISSVSYTRLVINPQNRIRIIAGAQGDEGTWGDFLINGDRDTWNSYELPGMPISDAIFLSAHEILACGMELRKASDEKSISTAGLLLYSADSGKNWTRVYVSNSTGSFSSLTQVGTSEFYAVSDAGTLLRFTLKDRPTMAPKE
jgi:photosystem II stability/assembly factor-like uncharacterized protein